MANEYTVEDVKRRVQRVLQDTDDDFRRYDANEVLDAVNDAILEASRIRPELFADVNFVPPRLMELEQPLPIEPQYLSAMVYMAAGYLSLRDDAFAVDARAVSLLNKGTSQLQTVKA